VLTKNLLRVSRGGGYHPAFVADDPDARRLAARVLGVYQGHVGETKRDLDAALTEIERESDDFKLVRGFAKLLDREATFETQAPLPPERTRRVVFETAERVGVADESDRERAIHAAADHLGTDTESVERSLYADRDTEQVLTTLDADWTPEELCTRYDFSLAATALFDATEVRLRASDPKTLVSAVERNGLLYEIRETGERGSADDAPDGDGGATLSTREVVVTGPDALFRRTRRYGTAFAKLLSTVARTAARWELTATIDDRGRERTLSLSEADVPVPEGNPVGEPAFDSGVEAEFAARFRALDLDWDLVREPEPLLVDPEQTGDTGSSDTTDTTDATDATDAPRVMIPDFAFDYQHADFRLFFEVMGFWTPSYVEKKLAQLAGVEDVDLLVAVDESLGVGEEIAATDNRVLSYSGDVRVKDVVDVLREYEETLATSVTADLPDELVPDDDVVSVESLTTEYDVPTDAMADVQFPDHERIGDVLVRPAVLESVAAELSVGQSVTAASDSLAAVGIDDTSAALSRLGYRVAWEGLGGGELVEKSD
jgi:predicted nuclease of restriction endonuclease-like RecB superfamily